MLVQEQVKAPNQQEGAMNKATKLLAITEILDDEFDDDEEDDDEFDDDEEEIQSRRSNIPFRRIISSMQKKLNSFAERETDIAEASNEDNVELFSAPSRYEIGKLVRHFNNMSELKKLDVYFESTDSRGRFFDNLLQVGENSLGGLAFIFNERADMRHWVEAYEDNWKSLLRAVQMELEEQFQGVQAPPGSFRPSKRSRAASARHRRERSSREGTRKGGFHRGSILQGVGRHPDIAKWRSHRKKWSLR